MKNKMIENQLQVLVVDDNKDVADTLTMLIRVLGHQTVQAYDGQSALELAAATSPDVVFLDLGMPLMNGFEVAQQLVASYPSPDFRLVAVTGHSDSKYLREAEKAGFTDYLVKPYVSEDIIKILAREP